MRYEHEPPSGVPRWVKVVGIVVAVVALLVVVVMLVSGDGGHRRPRHLPPGDSNHPVRTTVTDGGHAPPAGVPG
jgi:hypothetical protein